MAYLEVSNLSVSFGGLMVINDLSFSVDEHEIVSIIGPNGAGKSTTLNLITGINPPDRGDIRFKGRSLRMRSSSRRQDGVRKTAEITFPLVWA